MAMLYRPVLTTSTADRSRSSNHITARCLKPTQFFWLTTNIVGALYSLVMMYLPVIRLFSKVRDVSRNKHMPIYGSSNGLQGGQLLQVSKIPFSGLSDKLTNPVNSLMTWVVFSSPLLVQFSSVTQSCLTLCDPMNRSTPGLPAHHQLLEFTQTHVH